MKPFSTYPEDREQLMALARIIQSEADVKLVEKAADKLSDLVLSILSDEATVQFLPCEDGEFNGNETEGPLTHREASMIDEAWETYKSAGPVARVINDNQPGDTAIVKILRDPPTLGVGTELFARD